MGIWLETKTQFSWEKGRGSKRNQDQMLHPSIFVSMAQNVRFGSWRSQKFCLLKCLPPPFLSEGFSWDCYTKFSTFMSLPHNIQPNFFGRMPLYISCNIPLFFLAAYHVSSSRPTLMPWQVGSTPTFADSWTAPWDRCLVVILFKTCKTPIHVLWFVFGNSWASNLQFHCSTNNYLFRGFFSFKICNSITRQTSP